MGKLFMANRRLWLFFHLPRLPTKKLNQRLPGDLPDWWAVGRLGTVKEGVMLVIECKTGGGEQTEGQDYYMRCLLAVPGVSGGIYYPHQRAELVKLIGGDYV